MENHKEAFQLDWVPPFKLPLFHITPGHCYETRSLRAQMGGAMHSLFLEQTLMMSRIRRDKVRASVSKRWLASVYSVKGVKLWVTDSGNMKTHLFQYVGQNIT